MQFSKENTFCVFTQDGSHQHANMFSSTISLIHSNTPNILRWGNLVTRNFNNTKTTRDLFSSITRLLNGVYPFSRFSGVRNLVKIYVSCEWKCNTTIEIQQAMVQLKLRTGTLLGEGRPQTLNLYSKTERGCSTMTCKISLSENHCKHL